MGTTLLVALAATAMAAPSLPINQWLFGEPPVRGMHFLNAEIGMTLAEWKALHGPGGSTPEAQADCWPDPSGAVVCTYATNYGKVTLTQSVSISKRYVTQDLRYYFSSDRLSRIEFHTSIDAFNAVVAAIEATYGPATETIRDVGLRYDGWRLPRVQKVWRLRSGLIEVTDPSSRANELAVQLSAGSDDPSAPRAEAHRSTL